MKSPLCAYAASLSKHQTDPHAAWKMKAGPLFPLQGNQQMSDNNSFELFRGAGAEQTHMTLVSMQQVQLITLGSICSMLLLMFVAGPCRE